MKPGHGPGERSQVERPGEQSADRRDTALGAIEDLLIREGFIELFQDEPRTFPVTGRPDAGTGG